ncbi:MAG: general secretion pathway protein GspB [Deltaproteobacteria bacterium]|nr:general secretion pathway protein GspB [Deltaproteobacteria bacterium]
MSSILDSLKKLERETSRQGPLPTRVHAGGGVSIPKYVLAVIGGICLGFGAIGLVVYYRAAPAKTPGPQPVGTASEQRPVPTTGDRKTAQTARRDNPAESIPPSASGRPAAGPAGISTAEAAGNDPVAKRTLSEETAAGRDVETETAAVVNKPPEEKRPMAMVARELAPPPAVAEKGAADFQDAAPEKKPSQEEPVPMDRLEGVAMKVQAISWSETPGKRLAVVNSQVLREGDDIEGYAVSRINPDDIVLQRGGKAYRLDFRSAGGP